MSCPVHRQVLFKKWWQHLEVYLKFALINANCEVMTCYNNIYILYAVATVQILCIGTDRSQQTVQTKIRLLLKKQSDQGLRYLPFHYHLLDALMQCYIKLFYFWTIMAIV